VRAAWSPPVNLTELAQLGTQIQHLLELLGQFRFRRSYSPAPTRWSN